MKMKNAIDTAMCFALALTPIIVVVLS